MSVNKVMIVGRVGRDPEVRRTQNGDAVVSLRLATSETWRDKASGERKERTEWHSVVIFNEGLARVAEQYVKKGSQIYVEGQLQTRQYKDKDGAERYTTEIVLSKFRGELQLLDKRGDGDEAPRKPAGDSARTMPRHAQKPARQGSYADLDDEVPFSAEFR